MDGMALLNVRLDPDDARRAKALREAGIPVSRIVREAIRSEYDRRIAKPRGGRRPSRIVADILAELPDPVELPARAFGADDRRAVRRHVVAKLRGRRG
jgi:hypothetical protein